MSDPGSEVRRAFVGLALGAALGLLAAAFTRSERSKPASGTTGAEGVRRWRVRSKT